MDRNSAIDQGLLKIPGLYDGITPNQESSAFKTAQEYFKALVADYPFLQQSPDALLTVCWFAHILRPKDKREVM